MDIIKKLDLLREVYYRQSLSPEHADKHGMKVMIRDISHDVGDLIYGSGMAEVLADNEYILFTLNNLKILSDAEIFTRLNIIFNTVQDQVSKLVPVFFQYDHGVFIVQQNSIGDIVTHKWWEGGTVSLREPVDHH